MEIYDYTVEKEESGIRIDRYLAEKDSGLSRSFLQKLLKEGQITVGEKAAKSNYKVRENDRIHLEIRIPVSRISFRRIFRWIFFTRMKMY